MKFSEHWLRTLVNPPLDTAALCDKLTMAGLEVEDAAPPAPPFAGVVVGRIDAVAAHPNADRLRVCTVDAGAAASALQIVCGAPNAAAGHEGPLRARRRETARAGSRSARRRCAASSPRGMLCSAKELGIDDDASGLLRLPDDAVVGADLRAALRARRHADHAEAHAQPRRLPVAAGARARRRRDHRRAAGRAPRHAGARSPAALAARVRVEDSRRLPALHQPDDRRHRSRRRRRPDWMKERLQRSGIRSISAVVDITNYVMLELGQPLHAYDDRLLDGDIVVRFATEGEELTLLNGQVLKLESRPPARLRREEAAGARRHHGRRALGHQRHDDDGLPRGRVLEPGDHPGQVAAARLRQRRRLSLRARRRLRRLRARTRARHPADPRHAAAAVPVPSTIFAGACPERKPVRVRPARVARLLGIDLSRDAIASLLDRLQTRARAARRRPRW